MESEETTLWQNEDRKSQGEIQGQNALSLFSISQEKNIMVKLARLVQGLIWTLETPGVDVCLVAEQHLKEAQVTI